MIQSLEWGTHSLLLPVCVLGITGVFFDGVIGNFRTGCQIPRVSACRHVGTTVKATEITTFCGVDMHEILRT